MPGKRVEGRKWGEKPLRLLKVHAPSETHVIIAPMRVKSETREDSNVRIFLKSKDERCFCPHSTLECFHEWAISHTGIARYNIKYH